VLTNVKHIAMICAYVFICQAAFPQVNNAVSNNDFNSSHAISDSSQKVLQTLNSLSSRTLNVINNRYSLLDKLVERQTEKMLARMQKKEAALQKQMQGKDSIKAKQLFANTQKEYQQLLITLQSPPGKNILNPLREYIPNLDSIQTAMRFLTQVNNYKIPGIPLDKLAQIQNIGGQLQQLESRLQNANNIEQYVQQREQFLKNQLSNFGLDKQLLGINKEAYYYQQQLVEYKDMLNDPKKMEAKALEVINQVPAFGPFMQKYSYIGQLFGLPEDYGSPSSLDGLQTKALVAQLIGQKMGSTNAGGSAGGFGGGQFLQQQMGVAQQQLSQLQNKSMLLGNGGGTSNSVVMPDFKPNGERTKSFLQRLEYGFNIQTQKTNSLVPTTSALALILGYKINDKSTAGIGASYNLGLGSGINHIHFSSQGVGFRSYVDIKAKGSIWLSGGFEYNYLRAFQQLQQLYNLDTWQKSALLGLTKKIKVTKNKTCNLQLLYDFLYRDHLPVSQPLLFRMGYSF